MGKLTAERDAEIRELIEGAALRGPDTLCAVACTYEGCDFAMIRKRGPEPEKRMAWMADIVRRHMERCRFNPEVG